jgi:hypothetical protein
MTAVDVGQILDALQKEIAAATAKVQSPYLYLHAAGSDGSDGSAPGIHLRWDLLRSLGETHLPKGNLAAGPEARYPAPYGFNKTDDFVTVLRVPYTRHYPITVNVANDRMVAAAETGPQRSWTFEHQVVIRFADVAQYDAIRAAVDPLTAAGEFLTRYSGVVEAEVTGQLCFALTIIAAAPPSPQSSVLRIEAVSVSENLPGTGLLVSCRKRFSPALIPGPAGSVRSLVAENAKYFRFDYGGFTPLVLQLETYEQFLIGSIVNKADWAVVGSEFALTDQDDVVYERLEESALANVNRKWPRYLGADPASGLFTTSVPNYKAKWDPTLPPTNEPTDANGLGKGVADFLTLSMSPANATALASLPSRDHGDKGPFEISYLAMLKLLALDFHVARMLGLGCIDSGTSKEPPTKYVYVALYRTTAPLESVSPPAMVLPSAATVRPGGTMAFPVGLSVPVGANGAFVTLTSSNPAFASVSPASVFIPPGKTTSTLPVLQGIGIGTATITASAPGFAPASTQVHVAPVPSIAVPSNTTLKLGQAAPFAVTLSAPVPASGDSNEADPTVARTHVFMSLPTSRLDFRLPPAPVQRDPTFGIRFDNGTGTMTELTDADGYAPFDDSRIINLHVESYDTLQELGPFFNPAAEFCSCDVTKPVFYGCKYKLVSEANDRVPELSNDPEYRDAAGVAEVVPLLPQVPDASTGAERAIYTHRETENGKHRYAFYGVNWYSRPSALGNPKDVDTLIPKRSTLLPPANLAVQLIQPEDPLMLTTAGEQQKLAALSGGDTTLVRCTFDWNQNHYIPQKFSAANVYADKVQLCFRPQPPRAVQGEIKSVTSISDKQIEVRTQAYTNASLSPPQTVMPAVVHNDESRFVGSAFASKQILYVVDGVTQSTVAGEGAVFLLRKQTQSTVHDLDNNNQLSASVQSAVPSPGDRFLVVENMNNLANWGNGQPLAKEVTLVNFPFPAGGPLHTETVSYPDGTQATFNIGGIYETAVIVELPDLDDHGHPKSNSKSGIFEITFASYQLPPHPDAAVEWYKGSVRVPDAATNEMKPLDVWKIDVSGATLKLTVHDATFNVDSQYVPVGEYSPIRTGSNVAVNFHPGYRVYLTAQAGVLDETAVQPDATQSVKQTFLAARSRSSALAIESSLTAPVVLQARKITILAPPDVPSGPLYATRPDFYGKSTWTMDLNVSLNGAHDPYGFVFYRANERAVLDTLYKPETVDVILAALETLPAADAAFGPNRWKDLVNVTNLDADYGFHRYIANGYRFPIPDNDKYAIPETIPPPGPFVYPFDGVKGPGDPSAVFSVENRQVSMLEVVQNAINGVFLPLTESPVVYRFIKSGTQTSPRKPVVRNGNGDLLAFNDPAFDPSPMAARYVGSSGDKFVRFTDYTLDGAAKNVYFYYAVEMSEEMKLGPRSPIVGPIQLVNAYPAEPPVIRKVTSVIEDAVLGIPTGVKILLNAYIASEGITKFHLYRATNPSDAATTRSMKLTRTYDAAAGSETELFDDFSDLDFPPFGDPIFYRVVALREIVNERDEIELIPSLPSGLARASVIDVQNPIAPPLVFSSDPPTMSFPVQLPNVVLSWRRTAYNATYRLYKQGSSGNWNKIHQVKTNADPVIVPLASTDLATGVLLKQNSDGEAMQHRFKVEVENTSGMFSLNEAVLSVPATCKEGYSVLSDVVTYADAFQSAAPLTDQRRDPAVSAFPGSMTFQDIIASLPAAHVFDRTEVTVADGLGHAARKTINAAGGSVTFHHGDGTGIVLDGSVLNVAYAVRAKVFTDSCQDGLLFPYRLQFGPEVALMDIAGLLGYADSQNAASPLSNSFDPSGLQFPTTMSFTDISALPSGHTFDRIDILVQDDTGGSFSKSINAAHGSVIFNHGDGGLTLDASDPNRTYRISARLFTNLSPIGVSFHYSISYA